MPAISISIQGIIKLLCNLEPAKLLALTTKISPYIFKYCAALIFSILQLIFMHSLNTGQLLSDWL